MEIPTHLLQSILNDSAQKLDVKLQLPPNAKADVLGKLQQVKLLQQLATNRFVAQFTNAQTGQQQQLEVTLQPPLPQGTTLSLLAKSATDVNVRQIQLPPKIVQQVQQAPPQPASAPLLTAQPQRISLPANSPPLTLQQPLPQNIPQQVPLQATVQSAPQANGQQQLTLTLPPPNAQTQPPTITLAARLPQPLPQGSTLTLIASAGGSSAQQAQLNLTQATLPSGQTLTPQPVSNTPQIANITFLPDAPALPPQTTVRALPIPPNAPTAGTTNQTLELPSGQQLTVQTSRPLPPDAPLMLQSTPTGTTITLPTSTTAPLQPPLTQFFQGQTISATMQPGHNTDAINLRLTDGTQLNLQTKNAAPLTGSQSVSIQLQTDGNVQVFNTNTPLPPPGSQQDFSNLKQALAMLQQHRPDLLPNAQANVPQPHTLLPTLTQMADAMMTQVAERFLGDETVQFLRTIGVDITPDLQNIQLFQQRTDAPDGWRALLFPFMENPDANQRQGGFFWRGHGQEEEKGNRQVRFIMQLNLSQLGIVQLDGLMHQRHIQLKLRTHAETDDTFRQQLRHGLYTILTDLDLTGDIQFQTVETMPFDPMTLLQPSHPARA